MLDVDKIIEDIASLSIHLQILLFEARLEEQELLLLGTEILKDMLNERARTY